MIQSMTPGNGKNVNFFFEGIECFIGLRYLVHVLYMKRGVRSTLLNCSRWRYGDIWPHLIF